MRCAPPLRDDATRHGLWRMLLESGIQTIGSDHSPCPPEMKQGQSFFAAWGGISGLQHGLPLLWDLANGDALALQRLQSAASKAPAELLGIRDRGSLAIGQRADVCLVEIGSPEPIDALTLLDRHRLSPYAGLPLRHRIRQTWLGGQLIFSGGKMVGQPSGKFISV